MATISPLLLLKIVFPNYMGKPRGLMLGEIIIVTFVSFLYNICYFGQPYVLNESVQNHVIIYTW